MSSLYSYDIHLPRQLDSSRIYPTIFTLHGKGSNEQDMYGVVEPLSEEYILIGIRGDLPMGAGFQYYELKSLGNPLREQFDHAVEQLQAFVQYATDKYPIDPGKRYFLGFSQGAILSKHTRRIMAFQPTTSGMCSSGCVRIPDLALVCSGKNGYVGRCFSVGLRCMVGIIFIARSIGEFRWLGFFKKHRGSAFSKWDTLMYSPLCLLLGAAVIYILVV
jgi:hypothetical protein